MQIASKFFSKVSPEFCAGCITGRDCVGQLTPALVIITTFLSGPDLSAINPQQADLTAALIKSPDISTFNFVKEFET